MLMWGQRGSGPLLSRLRASERAARFAREPRGIWRFRTIASSWRILIVTFSSVKNMRLDRSVPAGHLRAGSKS